MLHRLLTLIRKELQSLLREKQTRAVLISPVLMMVIVFPFAATLDVTNANIAIFDEDSGAHSIELTQQLAKTKAFEHLYLVHNRHDLRALIDTQKVLLAIHFPMDFSRSLSNGQETSLQVILDGRRSNSAQIAASYVQQVVFKYTQSLLLAHPELQQLVNNNSELVVRNWYNPNLNYKWFVLPSLVALITTIGVMVVTSLSIAREREQGTFEQLLVTPLTTWQIFIGKAVPAILVAAFQGSIILLSGIFLYRIPFSGSLLLFYGCILIYGLSLVGFGLLISSLCSTQQQAFIGVFVFMMPAILLSGYISPVENMPMWLQDITWINPIQHFTNITKQIYLKDAGFSVVWKSLWPLLVITLGTGSGAYYIFRKQLA